jgi:hypothetical protein
VVAISELAGQLLDVRPHHLQQRINRRTIAAWARRTRFWILSATIRPPVSRRAVSVGLKVPPTAPPAVKRQILASPFTCRNYMRESDTNPSNKDSTNSEGTRCLHAVSVT